MGICGRVEGGVGGLSKSRLDGIAPRTSERPLLANSCSDIRVLTSYRKAGTGATVAGRITSFVSSDFLQRMFVGQGKDSDGLAGLLAHIPVVRAGCGHTRGDRASRGLLD